jgi:hypothetical protein
MQNENNKKIEPTENQSNPYLARPEEFDIMRADEAATKQVPVSWSTWRRVKGIQPTA